jgi:hypothetical protein
MMMLSAQAHARQDVIETIVWGWAKARKKAMNHEKMVWLRDNTKVADPSQAWKTNRPHKYAR